MKKLIAQFILILCSFFLFDFFQPLRVIPPLIDKAQRADLIVLEKAKHQLTLYRDHQVIKSYTVALGHDPVGPKSKEGDGKTPEGDYSIDSKNGRSRFHLALHISYPSEADRQAAIKQGVSPGSDIMIHGVMNGLGYLGSIHKKFDWTNGCVAVSNGEIEEIWQYVEVGTPIKMLP